MIPLVDDILPGSRFERKVNIISNQFQYLEDQFDSTLPKIREQVSLNTYHLARDQRQISKFTENTEFLIKIIVEINENIHHLKSSIEILSKKQFHFENETNKNLAALNKKVDSLTKKFKTLSLN